MLQDEFPHLFETIPRAAADYAGLPFEPQYCQVRDGAFNKPLGVN